MITPWSYHHTGTLPHLSPLFLTLPKTAGCGPNSLLELITIVLHPFFSATYVHADFVTLLL